jgi:RNA-directed DNA polymerase
LFSHIPTDRAILKKWLAAGFIERESFHLTTTGTPQGGIISPVLMNLTLDGLESWLAKHFPPRRGHLVRLVRFADDFITTGRTKEVLAEEVKPLIAEFLKPRGLRLSESKTRITHIETGFDFLGKHFQKHGGKLLIKPSRQNVQAFLAEIKATFRENLHTPVERLLMHLNPQIRGWAMFHRTTTSKKVFNYVDYRIFCELEHWMQRRHPDQSLRWCYEKYLTQVGDRQYVWQGSYQDRRGKPRTIRLLKAADVPIKRHVKIKAAANPYDPNWETYFEERLALQMKDNLHGYDKLLRLWFNQDGLCPQCGQKVTPETGWHLHHRVWVVNGGDDSMANLVVMHPICHLQLHAQVGVAESFCWDAASPPGGV